MAQYFNISGNITQELLAAGGNARISSVMLTNSHDTLACNVDLYIEKKNEGKFYLLKNTTLPIGPTLLHDAVSFSNAAGEFGLYIKLTTSSGTPTVDVILK
jgi:hypothetical protein|tara:strand:+ start:837 stop:1139 length:303 start_codon:yes stop_codon:yes gene_type:complete